MMQVFLNLLTQESNGSRSHNQAFPIFIVWKNVSESAPIANFLFFSFSIWTLARYISEILLHGSLG